MSLADDEEWMPLRQAVLEVAEAYSKFMHCSIEAALPDAVEAIHRRARNGVLVTRAKQWMTAIDGGEGRFSLDSHNGRWGEMLPPDFWLTLWWAGDAGVFDWIAGEAEATCEATDELTYEFCFAFGIEVTRNGLPLVGGDHINGSLAITSVENLQASERRVQAISRGRKSAHWWPKFAIEFALFCLEEGLPGGIGTQGQSKVIDEVFGRMEVEGSRTQVQSVVNEVLTRWRSAGK